MPSRLSAVPRLATGFVAFGLCALSLSAFARKPVPPPPEPPPPPPGVTVRVSVAADGTEGSAASFYPVLSPDARYVVFSSSAANLVAGDTNGKSDVFVHDRATGSVERVNVASDGTQANDSSYEAAISADGRYVAFESSATNLVPGEQHYYTHVYLHDRVTRTTERVSVASDGTPANSYSSGPAVSADGRYVAFDTYAGNLAPGDSNGLTDVYVRDRATGTTERVSVAADGASGNGRSGQAHLSSDGRYVLFLSDATNLVGGDTNAATDLFLYDRQTRAPERVSLGAGGIQADGASYGSGMSPDARYVVFSSEATNLVGGDTNGVIDVFLRDRSAGLTERINVSSTGSQTTWADSFAGSVSADGNVVAFTSYADYLVPVSNGYYGEVYVRVRSNATTELVSLASDGTLANDEAGIGFASVSADGRFVAFGSWASNLVAGDTNGVEDVFVRERYNSP